MQDDEIEAALRRYRARDPRGDLRRRVLEAAATDIAPREVAWFWGPLAAAAILVLWFTAHVSRIEAERDPLREADVARVAEALGGGEEAVRYAELIVPQPVPEAPSPITMEQAW
jgi:hypothetical protein